MKKVAHKIPEFVGNKVKNVKKWHTQYVGFRKTTLESMKAESSSSNWSITDLCSAYNWATGLPGGGQIAIVELGGGWIQSDLVAFCNQYNIPVPTITDVSVDGTNNSGNAAEDASVEVALDIQAALVAYWMAVGSVPEIFIYWASDIAPAVAKAAADGRDCCSISWGASEINYGQTSSEQMEQTALNATNSGMVVLAAAGDNSSSDGSPGSMNVDIPGGCPHVISAGGTSKIHNGVESVWGTPGNPDAEGTGGGFSSFFPTQSWQINAPLGSGRMVPDIVADADPNTGINIYVNGSWGVVAGTSFCSPFYSGYLAACGKKLGFITPKLWANPTCFVEITSGGNGQYNAGPGPEPCTGLGVLNGKLFASLLMNVDPVVPPPPVPPTPVPVPPPVPMVFNIKAVGTGPIGLFGKQETLTITGQAIQVIPS